MRGEDPLGFGVVYSPRLGRVLDLDLLDVLEIEPQMFWRKTGDAAAIAIDRDLFATLRAMPQHKLVHSVSFPVGNSRPHDPAGLACLRDSIDALGAPYASEHLSFNEFDHGAGRQWTGFFLPPRQDRDGIMIAARRIDELRRAVGVPVAFETGVNYLRPRADELADGVFIRGVAEAADCGILLDLHNLLANERNGRGAAREVIAAIPLERVWEIHLGGGMPYRGYWLDAHSGPIDEELYALTRQTVELCPNLRAIIFEIMDQYVDDSARDALQQDVRRLRTLWEGRRRRTQVPVPSHRAAAGPPALTGARCRERTLGALALGFTPAEPEPGLADDPAVALYADLVASMREGVLHQALPFLVRLLMVSLGPRATMDLIAAFHANLAPEQFGSDEAGRFLAFVRRQAPDVPYLEEIAAFEAALHAVNGTAETRRVRFTCDPFALLSALRERRRPEGLPKADVEVDVDAAGIVVLMPADGV